MKNKQALDKFNEILKLAVNPEDTASVNYLFREKLDAQTTLDQLTLDELDNCLEWFSNPRKIFKKYVNLLIQKHERTLEGATDALQMANEYFFGATLAKVTQSIKSNVANSMQEVIDADRLLNDGITYVEYEKYKLILDNQQDLERNSYDLNWKVETFLELHRDVIQHYYDFLHDFKKHYSKNIKSNTYLKILAEEIYVKYSNYIEQYKHDPLTQLVEAEILIEEFQEKYTKYRFEETLNAEKIELKDELLQQFNELIENNDLSDDFMKEIKITISYLQRIDANSILTNSDKIQNIYKNYLNDFKYRILEIQVKKIIDYRG